VQFLVNTDKPTDLSYLDTLIEENAGVYSRAPFRFNAVVCMGRHSFNHHSFAHATALSLRYT
jgi:hypothetical protein